MQIESVGAGIVGRWAASAIALLGHVNAIVLVDLNRDLAAVQEQDIGANAAHVF